MVNKEDARDPWRCEDGWLGSTTATLVFLINFRK